MPVVLVRTDLRAEAGTSGPYNPMLTQAATVRLDLPFAATEEVTAAVLKALEQVGTVGRGAA